MRVLANRSFAPQRITGQQRYAHEIADRLTATTGCGSVEPVGRWARSPLRVWLWVQLVLPWAARRALLVSLTSRAPLWRRRHVLVVHDLFVLTNPEWFSRLYVWTHAPLLWAQIRSAAAVIAVSGPTAAKLARWRRDPVAVAPNAPSAVFTRRDDEHDDAVLVARGLVQGAYFLAVGSRDPRKNLPRLLAAYGELRDDERSKHPLVVVGGGAHIYRDEALTWPDGAVDAGYVDDDALRALYRGARSVVLVSLAEGFGLPLVEAAAAGASSLLVSDIEVFRWICEDNARYVDPTSTAAITAGLRAEINDPHGQEMNVARFSWDAAAVVVRDVCHAAAQRR
jgi:glycosyltransferase involved in cell wall biosynthesis